MILNYLKIAFRNIARQRFYFLINIIGLSVGIASCMLIFSYVRDELSYDRFHANSENIYRLVMKGRFGGTEFNAPLMPPIAGPTMLKDFPEVKNFVRFRFGANYIVQYQDKIFKENNILWADSSLFSVFSFKLRMGDSRSALSEPKTIVISEKTSKKYFGDNDPKTNDF